MDAREDIKTGKRVSCGLCGVGGGGQMLELI